MQNMEMELHGRNQTLEEKEKLIKSLLKQNEILNEKICLMENDLKIILQNRQKLENLEGIIYTFMKSDKIDNNYNYNKENYGQSYNNTNNNYMTLSTSNNFNNSTKFRSNNFKDTTLPGK
jgi:hypothetical protein